MRSLFALAFLLTTACGGADELGTDPVPETPRAGEIRVCLADCGREGPTVTCLLSTAPECPAASLIPEWCDRARVVWSAPRAVEPCNLGN